MGGFYPEIPPKIFPWIAKQEIFWVATAPLNGNGHVNISPKGTKGTFHVVDSKTCWYEDLTGSGIETISHIREEGNNRITILFNAFEGPPRILRLFGTGEVHEIGTPGYEARISPEERNAGSRSVIVINIHKVNTSCGFSVPYYKFEKHRNILRDWVQKLETRDLASEKGRADDGLQAYWAKANCSSIDGLSGLELGIRLKASNEGESVTTWFRSPPPKELGGVKAKTNPTNTASMWWSWGSLNSLGPQFGVGLLVGVTVATLLHRTSLAR